MNRKFFGTDGIRGQVGTHPMTPEFAMQLGYAAGLVLSHSSTPHHRSESPTVLLGKDTRISGYMFEAALEAGFSAAGVNVALCGPLPTPAVSYLTRALRLDCGVVISASHNPYSDNGIKFFSSLGEKLPDEIEKKIESQSSTPMSCVPSKKLGKATRINDAAGRYIEFCKSSIPSKINLRNLKIIVDCAHGSAYQVAPRVFYELGAEVITIGSQPDGLNINHQSGSTSPESLQKAVLEHQADIGVALDGDGDRLCLVDNSGHIYNGDAILYILAEYQKNTLKSTLGAVGTLMSGLGLEKTLSSLNIPFYRANVGDRYVLQALKENQWRLGAENSGHVICLDKHNTGDGIIAALQVLHILTEQSKTLQMATKDLLPSHQKLINIPHQSKMQSLDPDIQSAINSAEKLLSQSGRILVRPSGTEPLIRVMLESTEEETVNLCAKKIQSALKNKDQLTTH